MHSHSQKTVIVTGGSRGIGKEIAIAFASHGWGVGISYHAAREDAEKVLSACRHAGSDNIHAWQLDLSNTTSVSRFADAVISRFGSISVLIHNAGVAYNRFLPEQDLAVIEEQMRVNLEGPIKLTRLLIEHIEERIISIGSGAGKGGIARLAPYSATKFGIRGFMQSIAVEYPNLRCITVNADRTATRMSSFVGRDPAEVARAVFAAATSNDPNSEIDIWKFDPQ